MTGEALWPLLEAASGPAFGVAPAALILWFLLRQYRRRREVQEIRPRLAALQGAALGARTGGTARRRFGKAAEPAFQAPPEQQLAVITGGRTGRPGPSWQGRQRDHLAEEQPKPLGATGTTGH